MLSRCRIVLVRPQIAGNLGATARVMRNMGLKDLFLVEPHARPDDPLARKFSTQGQAILDAAKIVRSLSDAVADCLLVAATSARLGGPFRSQSVGHPRVIMPLLVDVMTHGPIALVFGPEPTGLTNEEVAACHHLIHIPTDGQYPALNLAQAVAICTYELRCASLEEKKLEEARVSPAPYALQERMFTHLQKALEDIHFLYGTKSKSLMHALRHLIGRAGPSTMEVKVLMGLARQIRWFRGQLPAQFPPQELADE